MAEVTHLGNGIHRITLPLPFPAPTAVNCYAFEGSDGLTLLDCGIDGDDEFARLVDGFGVLGATPSDLHRLIGSHLHVDHMGMAKRIVEATGCEWVMHAGTGAEVTHYNDWSERTGRLARLAVAAGAPTAALARSFSEMPRPPWFSEAIPPSHPVEDGALIPLDAARHLRVLFTPGHQANHLCLVDSLTGRLFSGDHILPRISPFIPYTGEDDDHLGAYLLSLARVAALDPPVTHPAHGPTIERGAARARQILLHHERRLETMLEQLEDGPRTAWQVMEAAFRPNLSPLEERLAFQETMAHLENLVRTGRADRFDDGGVRWYCRT